MRLLINSSKTRNKKNIDVLTFCNKKRNSKHSTCDTIFLYQRRHMNIKNYEVVTKKETLNSY